jgi:hypothetical protein
MSPRPYQPHCRHPQHNISPQHHYHANQHRYYQPQFVTPYSSPPQQYYYYDSPCNLHYHQFNMANNDAAEASRPNKKSKVEQPPPKATKAPVPGKGLRHFSMKICDRVKSKGSTSYSEVADEVRACTSCASNNLALCTHVSLYSLPINHQLYSLYS